MDQEPTFKDILKCALKEAWHVILLAITSNLWVWTGIVLDKWCYILIGVSLLLVLLALLKIEYNIETNNDNYDTTKN